MAAQGGMLEVVCLFVQAKADTGKATSDGAACSFATPSLPPRSLIHDEGQLGGGAKPTRRKASFV